MRILYAAGPRFGAGLQAKRIIENLSQHEVKVAAFAKSSLFLKHVDWTLDPLYARNHYSNTITADLLPVSSRKKMNRDILETLMSDISLFEPDLVISDQEYTITNIAQAMKIPFWYCSPIPLCLGIKFDDLFFRYFFKIDPYRVDFYYAPVAERNLIYSPFGDLFRDKPAAVFEARLPKTKTNYEWCSPYFIPKSTEESIGSDLLMIINNLSRHSEITKIANYSDYWITLASLKYKGFTKLHGYDINDTESYKQLLAGADRVFSTGDTSSVSDAFYNGKPMVISPDLNDPESMINASLIRRYYLGPDIGQFELMDKYSLDAFEGALKKPKYRFLSKKRTKNLHEVI